MISNIIESSPKEIDLTNDQHSELIIQSVESLLETNPSIQEIDDLESDLIKKNDNSLIFPLLSLKIARSKILAADISKPLLISVVFAVYKEHNRIKKSSEHPHGENFLLKKVNQLEWLFKDQPNVKWELIVVDDGCPEGSGRIAQAIIDENNLHDKVRVLYLSEAIEEQLPPVKGLLSTNGSQKGGSIVYGMWDAVQRSNLKNQVVAYTDADLSTHLGQLMLLVDPLLKDQKLAAIGSRREPNSVVVKAGSRNDRGKLFIYLWKRLIPNLGNIIDTQCGFKAFRSDIIPIITKEMIEKKFSFDIELLLKTQQYQEGSIIKVPIAWIDSEAASTTTDIQPYLPMLKAIVKMNKTYFPEDSKTNEFAPYIESMDAGTFNQLLDHIPEEITSREPKEFTEYAEVKVSDLK